LSGIARVVSFESLVSSDWQPGPRRVAGSGQHEMREARTPTMVLLVRPLLDLPKSRLIATLRDAGLAYAEDPSNADPRFTRARLRKLMPILAQEGLTARRLAHLALRVRRSEAALEAVVNWVAKRLGLAAGVRAFALGRADWHDMPAEIALRLLGRAIALIGYEGPVELGKLEVLHEALNAALLGDGTRFRRTLAGAMVSLQKDCIVIERAPARRARRAT
jgi:tRNA(Ile)-lysidine synthase